MPSTLEEHFLKRYGEKGFTIGVAIDGSNLSDKALQAACGFYSKERGDKLVILHVSDASKKYLARHLLPAHLKSLYVGKAQDQQVEATWACQEKQPGQSTCEALTALAEANKVDLLVLGSFGRKGEKLDMLGTVSDYSLRESHCSVCVVRSTTPSVADGDGRCYLFCTDGSRASALAFCVLTHQIVKPQDKVLVVSAAATLSPDFFKPYEDLMKTAKVSGQCVNHKLGPNDTVAGALLQLAKLKEVTSIVVGISGYGKDKLGSVSEEISIQALCNTVVIKDSYEILDSMYANAGAKTLSDYILPEGTKKRLDRASHGRNEAYGGIPAVK
eukprot:jgi/Chrzof1/107/Cz01g03220.t1